MHERPIGIVGAGTMGAGIAQLAAQTGHEATVYEPDPGARRKGSERVNAALSAAVERGRIDAESAADALDRLNFVDSPGHLGDCGIVIEAGPENLGLKQEIFHELDQHCGSEAVLASNTSSISIGAIASATADPGRICGMHFFNPPVAMRLVEIVSADSTRPATGDRAFELATAMGRTPIRATDSIGFVANRLNRPYSLEALKMLGEGFASAAEIDRVCRDAGGFRMGPFELMDLVGIDVGLSVARSFWEQSFHEPRWQPHPIQQQMVDLGRLGRKTGRGFHDYAGGAGAPAERREVDPIALIEEGGQEATILATILAQLINEAHFGLGAGIASREDCDTAMRLGFNWPRGPFEWAELIGPDRVLGILDHLWQTRREERYRPAPALRAAAGNRPSAAR